MQQDLRNVFISHIHEDDDGLHTLKDLVAKRGMICRDGSITTGKFNSVSNEDYIKYLILAPRIKWASVLVVCISPETKDSDWVNWEIEYAQKEGKRIVGVWKREGYEIMLIADRSMRQQQNIAGRQSGVVVLLSNRWTGVQLRIAEIRAALAPLKRSDQDSCGKYRFDEGQLDDGR